MIERATATFQQKALDEADVFLASGAQFKNVEDIPELWQSAVFGVLHGHITDMIHEDCNYLGAAQLCEILNGKDVDLDNLDEGVQTVLTELHQWL